MNGILNQYKRILLAGMLAIVAYSTGAQNTLDGEAKIVPEEEVNRQSEFIDAEGERLLGHYDKAVEKYKAFLYNNGENAAAWYGLARSYAELKDPVKAMDAIAKAVAKDLGNQWYLIFQADLYEQVGQAKDAVTVYQELVKRHPQTTDFYERLAYLQVLAADPKSALKTLDDLEKITGVTEITADKKHVIYLGMGNIKKAAAELEKLADTYPYRLEYRHRLAELYDSVGDKDAARKVYEDILKRNPDDPIARIATLEKSGSDLAYLTSLKPVFKDPNIPLDGKIKEIIPYFEKMNKGLDPAAVDALLDLGALLETAHPNDPKSWSLSGDLFYYTNLPTQALERYRQCIRLNPTVYSVWDNTLAILYGQKNYSELLKTAELAMDAFPNKASAYYYYGVAATELGNSDEAINQLQQAVLMAGSNVALRLDIIDQIGLALLRKKDFETAKTHYEKYLGQGGDKHPLFLEHYGDALFQTGARDQAREFWQKANSLSPSPALEQKISTGKL